MNISAGKPVRRHLPAVAVAALLAFATLPATAAPTTFAQYFQIDGALQSWTISTVGTRTTVTSDAPVLFIFSGVPGLPFSGPEQAIFTLRAQSDEPGNCGVNCGAGDSYVQPGYTGTFSFIDAGAAPGANLLSGTFAVTGSPSTTGAQFSSSVGGTGASFNASATAGNLGQLVLTSDYLGFPGAINETASFSLSSLIPNFTTGTVNATQAYPATGPFTASGSGTFSSDPAPVNAVPEPATLALLGMGLLGVGLSRRARREAGAA